MYYIIFINFKTTPLCNTKCYKELRSNSLIICMLYTMVVRSTDDPCKEKSSAYTASEKCHYSVSKCTEMKHVYTQICFNKHWKVFDWGFNFPCL